MNFAPIDDNFPFPFGKHYGKPIGNMPADYLIWALENVKSLQPNIREYIKGVEPILRKEIAEQKAASRYVSDALRTDELADRDKFMQRYNR